MLITVCQLFPAAPEIEAHLGAFPVASIDLEMSGLSAHA